jgi:hypothetical protein
MNQAERAYKTNLELRDAIEQRKTVVDAVAKISSRITVFMVMHPRPGHVAETVPVSIVLGLADKREVITLPRKRVDADAHASILTAAHRIAV